MQNTEASVASAGTPGVTAPAGAPVSLIVVQAPLPKQPGAACAVQKTPFANVWLTGPVTSGDRLTGMVPTKVPSMYMFPGVQGCVASAPPLGKDDPDRPLRPSAAADQRCPRRGQQG